MPIRPENKARYPKDWPQIRLRILSRAGYRCEYPDCKAAHGFKGYWRDGQFVRMPIALREAGYDVGDIVACSNGEELKIIKIVLTIAHLDHTPEHNSDDNLRAWCQRHHLGYDAEHHKQTAYATRKANDRTADMFAKE